MGFFYVVKFSEADPLIEFCVQTFVCIQKTVRPSLLLCVGNYLLMTSIRETLSSQKIAKMKLSKKYPIYGKFNHTCT